MVTIRAFVSKMASTAAINDEDPSPSVTSTVSTSSRAMRPLRSLLGNGVIRHTKSFFQNPIGEGVPPTIALSIPRRVLRGGVDNDLVRRSHSLARRVSTLVRVEANTSDVKDVMYYAATLDGEGKHIVPTEFVKCSVLNDSIQDDIVKVGDDFEMSFVGFSVAAKDGRMGDNEPLLFSLSRKDDEIPIENIAMRGVGEKPTANKQAASSPADGSEQTASETHSEIRVAPVPAGYSINSDDIVTIHYSEEMDGFNVGTAPNTFVPVPASKSLYYSHIGHESQTTAFGNPSAPLRFLVLEVDAVNPAAATALSGANTVGEIAKGAPYGQAISSAVNIASSLGRAGLQNYAKPDHVLSVDEEFLLDDDTKTECRNREVHGNFLRYGYYFFLEKKTNAKLYAQTGSSSQTTPLMMRRIPFTKEMEERNEREFVPLTGLSYVAMRVTRGLRQTARRNREGARKGAREKVESIVRMNEAMELLADAAGFNSVDTAQVARSVQGIAAINPLSRRGKGR